jgi:hypothetical protein
VIASLPLVLLAMDMKSLGAIGMIALVAVIALLARAAGGRDESIVRPPSDAPSDGGPGGPNDGANEYGDGSGDDADDEDLETVEVVAVTSDGYALVPDTHAVRLVPPPEDGEGWKAGTTGHSRRGQRGLDMSWHSADFTGGRVVQGAADEGPWRFEAMGRDGEYTAFVFETREGADAALALFRSRGVIRLGRDEDGNEVPPSVEQFEQARRVFLETEAALDQDDE